MSRWRQGGPSGGGLISEYIAEYRVGCGAGGLCRFLSA